MRRYVYAYIFLHAFLSSASASQEHKLETTYVSAQSQKLSNASSIVLNEQDYAYESLESLLNKSAGIQTQTAGATGSYSSIWIRGASSKASGIYLDGIKINDPLNGGVNLSTLPLWAFESIDIYKSKLPSSIGFGDASNGLMLNTRSQLTHPENNHDLKLSYGSFNQQTISANSSYKNTLFSAEYFSADNDFNYLHNNNTNFNQLDDYQTKRSNNQVERKFALLKNQETIYDLNTTSLLLARNYTTGISNSLNQAKYAHLEQASVIAAVAIEPTEKEKTWKAKVSLNLANHLYNDLNNEIGLSSDKQNLRYSELSTGISFNHNKTKTPFFISKIWKMKSQLNIAYLMLDGEEFSQNSIKNINLNKHQYSLSHSISGEVTQVYASVGALNTADKKQKYWSIGGDVNFSILGLESIASISRKVRLPTISELYLNQGNQAGNSELNPEIFHEISFKSQFNRPIFGFEIESFYRKSENAIVFSYNAQGVGSADNHGASNLYGIDIKTNILLGEIQIDTSASLMHSENQIRNSAYSGKYLPNFFHLTSFLRFIYPIKHWQVGIENQTRSGLYYDSANSQKAKDQNYINLTFERSFKNGLAAIKISNILDKQYTGFKTEPLPSRTGLISIQYQL